MSGKQKRIEQIIEETLAEAKRKKDYEHDMKHKKDEDEDEEDEKETSYKKKMHKKEDEMKEAYKESGEEHEDEEEKESGRFHSRKKKMTEAKYEEEEEEESPPKKHSKHNMKKHKMDESVSQAQSSLKPHSGHTDPMQSVTKSGVMKSAMSIISGMSSEDLNKFNATMAQFGPNKTYGVGDNSDKNKSSIDMKTGSGPKTEDPMPTLNVKEDIDAMFVGEKLSEEFKEKASTLFEAAVSARVIAETALIEEAYQEVLKEELELFTEEVTDKLDAYLDYVVENWMEENEVAIESTLRNEIMEEFIDGLRNLFVEHYIDMPETKIDVVESLAEKVDELETLLDETIVENTEMKDILSDVAKEKIYEELSSDLVLTQREKFLSLSEGIEFDGDIDIYEKKLRIIKETYFNNDYVTSNLEEETFEGDVSEKRNIDPVVNKYVQALTRTVKN